MIVIVIDTLRADRLGAYGNQRGLTPFLDSLAARGIVFTQAYAQSSWTNPSVASLFTSRFQSQHRVVAPSSRMADSEVTLAEALHDRRYATGGFSANGLLAGHVGFAQGFDEYKALWPSAPDASHYYGEKRRAERINELGLEWLDRQRCGATKPFFLYLHYVEPHTPYSPPAAVLERLYPGRPAPDLDMVTTWMLYWSWVHPTTEQIRQVEDVYDAEVASMDASLRDLFGALETRHCLDHTFVVITSDHGEEFLEHEGLGHGKTLYDEVIHVPLLMLTAGRSAPIASSALVSLIDVAPTLLDLAGAAIPKSFEGTSLAGRFGEANASWLDRLMATRGDSRGSPTVLSELLPPPDEKDAKPRTHQRAILRDGLKLIVDRGGDRQAYDLRRDPGERSPTTDAESPALLASLAAFETRVTRNQAVAAPVDIDPETRARIRALGYAN